MGEWITWFFTLTLVLGIFLGVNNSWVNITPSEWHKAEEHCSTNEGIEKFLAKTLDDNVVVCKNSARFILKGEGK